METRTARLEDSTAIAVLIQRAFGEAVEPAYVRRVLDTTHRITYVAISEERVVGFIDGFSTMSQGGLRRWELDLLAVYPEYRGQGVGRTLIDVLSRSAMDADSRPVRALVAFNNTPMHRAMTRSGYSADPAICELHVSSGTAGDVIVADEAHIIPVVTLSYRGIWVEGAITERALRAAQAICYRDNFDIVGSVIRASDKQALQVAQDAGFCSVGRYRWWRLHPDSG